MLKIDDLIFFECPISYISSKSWEILELVNETTDAESGTILHLPYDGPLTRQPCWYREAVKVKRNERLSDWYGEELRRRMDRDRKRNG